MEIRIPECALVLMIGASGSGKSTFAKKHFGPFEVVSSDTCRGIVSNDPNNQKATNDAFDLLRYTIGLRLRNKLLTVVDATNVQTNDRKKLIELARSYHILPAAIVLNLSKSICENRNAERADRNFGSHVIRSQNAHLRRSIKGLKREGFRSIHILNSPEEVDQVTSIVREKLYNDKKEHTGPFDIIGDIHGCYDETVLLLKKLNYSIEKVASDSLNQGFRVSHPEGRKVIFVGDLTDRGPKSPEVLRLVMSMVYSDIAYCVVGNHDAKLLKKLNGKSVKLNHGLAETMEQLENEPDSFIQEVKQFLYKLTSHYIFDKGRLVVAHAGIKESMIGGASGAVRAFCMFGETTGEIDEFGLPVRLNWATNYRGSAKIVYGHTPVLNAEWLNNTIDIDTGCVFGGKLTALRYPEEELVTVDAKQVYCEPVKPLDYENKRKINQQQINDDLLHISDVTGKRFIQTRLRKNLKIQEENSIAALEVMSRFAVNPKWLIYLPPTMSPCETSELPDFLEHPKEAIDYYKSKGIEKIVCEEKHMGSRAIVIVCKDNETVEKRFGLSVNQVGICYTRTGRNFFNDKDLEISFLKRISNALTQSGFWEKHSTDWVCLDCELMPWSAKAKALLKDQYAAVGSAASHALSEVNTVLKTTADRNIEGLNKLIDQYKHSAHVVDKYTTAYQHYCWEVESLDDYILAPFHIMATEGAVHVNKSHEWHMENIKAFCEVDQKLLLATPYKIVDLKDENNINDVIAWWRSLTEKGGEGMVVKPFDYLTYGKRGLVQPAIKCRGKEYLRIIYGPEYDSPKHLQRLKKRGLKKKRSLAIRELALGIESLERFVRQEPLRYIHEAVFGVLALESEEVDPRL